MGEFELAIRELVTIGQVSVFYCVFFIAFVIRMCSSHVMLRTGVEVMCSHTVVVSNGVFLISKFLFHQGRCVFRHYSIL